MPAPGAAPSPPEPGPSQASSSTETHELEQPCEESEPAGGLKPDFIDRQVETDTQDNVYVGTLTEAPRGAAAKAPMDCPDSSWRDVAGNDRASILRRLTNEQLADFARGMNVHELGFVDSSVGCATARQMKYIIDLNELAHEPLNTRAWRTIGAALLEIDRLKPIGEGVKRRR